MELVDAGRLQALVVDLFSRVPGSGLESASGQDRCILLVDNVYAPVTRTDVDRIARADPLLVPAPENAQGELDDCDDYALHMKAALTTLFRQRRAASAADFGPPAVGIVISEVHAVNAFVSMVNGDATLFLIDTSRPNRPVTKEPDQVAALLLQRPAVRLIYF